MDRIRCACFPRVDLVHGSTRHISKLLRAWNYQQVDAAPDGAGTLVGHVYNKYLIVTLRADCTVPLSQSVGVSDGGTFVGEKLVGGDVVGHEHDPNKSRE